MIELSPKQARWIVQADSPVNIWHGSVRSGKTVGSIWRWAQHMAHPPTGGQFVMVGKTLQALYRNVILPMQDPAQFGPLAQQVHYTQGAPQAVILGRPVHMIGASDAKAEAKIRGMTVAGAYVDEATLVPELFWNQLLTRMSVVGSRLFATTNPDSPSHWLRREFLLSTSPLVRSFGFKIDDNPFLPAEFVAGLKAQFHGLFYRRFIDGEWVAAEGAVYDMWDPDRHVVDILPAISSWLCVGIDYGTANPFHAVLLGLGADGCLYIGAEWRYDGRTQMRQLTDAEYADRLEGWLTTEPVRGHKIISPTYLVVDPSALSFRTELKSRSIVQTEAVNAVLDGIRLTSTLLGKGQLKVHRSCVHLCREFDGYSWDDRASLLGEDRPVKADDHGMDALRYAVATTQRLWRPRLRLAA